MEIKILNRNKIMIILKIFKLIKLIYKINNKLTNFQKIFSKKKKILFNNKINKILKKIIKIKIYYIKLIKNKELWIIIILLIDKLKIYYLNIKQDQEIKFFKIKNNNLRQSKFFIKLTTEQ